MIWKRKSTWIWIGSFLILFVFAWAFRYDIAERVRGWLGIELPEDPRPAGISDLEWCDRNYRDEIRELSDRYGISYPYLMALIVLECNGNKPAGNRFEKHVYRKLQEVKSGKRRKFENIRAEQLADLDDEGLKNLASSWGPFQLMGYKAIPLDVTVRDMRDESTAAEVGVRWIKAEYGHFLDKKKYKDAFHIHNTGDRFPLSGVSKTHDPYYVSDGIRYMKYFEKHQP